MPKSFTPPVGLVGWDLSVPHDGGLKIKLPKGYTIMTEKDKPNEITVTAIESHSK